MPDRKGLDIRAAVLSHLDENRYGASNGVTHCNSFVRDVVEGLLKQTRPELAGLANAQFDALSGSGSWSRWDLGTATQEQLRTAFAARAVDAEEGAVIVLAYRNAGGHGHVALLSPTRELANSGTWGVPVPYVAQAGPLNPRGKAAEATTSVFSELEMSWAFSAARRVDMRLFVLQG